MVNEGINLLTEKAHATKFELQVLEGVVLGEGDTEKTRPVYGVGVYRTLIRQRTLIALKIRTGGNEDECGQNVNDTAVVDKVVIDP